MSRRWFRFRSYRTDPTATPGQVQVDGRGIGDGHGVDRDRVEFQVLALTAIDPDVNFRSVPWALSGNNDEAGWTRSLPTAHEHVGRLRRHGGLLGYWATDTDMGFLVTPQRGECLGGWMEILNTFHCLQAIASSCDVADDSWVAGQMLWVEYGLQDVPSSGQYDLGDLPNVDLVWPVMMLDPEYLVTSVLPAQALPASALPAQALPAQFADLARTSALPAQLLAWDALPAQALPAQALPAQALPAQALPASAIPSNALPVKEFSLAIPSNMFLNALPASMRS